MPSTRPDADAPAPLRNSVAGPGGRTPRAITPPPGARIENSAPVFGRVDPDAIYTRLPGKAEHESLRVGDFMYRADDGNIYQLGRSYGQGTFSQVYRLAGPGNEGLVIKFRLRGERQTRPRSDDAIAADRLAGNRDPDQTVTVEITPRDMVEASRNSSDLLHRAKIEQANVHTAHLDGETPYLIVEEVGGKDVEMFGFKSFGITKDYVFRPQEFTPKHQRAVAELYKQLADARLSAEDLHIENIYFRTREDGSVVAGVLDHDRIGPANDAYFDQLRRDLVEHQFDAERLIANNQKPKVKIKSLLSHEESAFEFKDPEHFMAVMLEHKGFIEYNPATGVFRGTKIDLEVLKGLFDPTKYLGPVRRDPTTFKRTSALPWRFLPPIEVRAIASALHRRAA
ncbi:MAG: hypothetical protein ACT4PL_08860 [Phycisphaerales bacterium]